MFQVDGCMTDLNCVWQGDAYYRMMRWIRVEPCQKNARRTDVKLGEAFRAGLHMTRSIHAYLGLAYSHMMHWSHAERQQHAYVVEVQEAVENQIDPSFVDIAGVDS
jgi:hypothetical protein